VENDGDFVYKNKKLISSRYGFRVNFPKKPILEKYEKSGMEAIVFMAGTSKARYNVVVIRGKQSQKNKIDSYYKSLLKKEVEIYNRGRFKKGKLVFSKKIRFKGKDTLKYKIKYSLEGIEWFAESVKVILDDRSINITINYPGIYKKELSQSNNALFGSLKIIRRSN